MWQLQTGLVIGHHLLYHKLKLTDIPCVTIPPCPQLVTPFDRLFCIYCLIVEWPLYLIIASLIAHSLWGRKLSKHFFWTASIMGQTFANLWKPSSPNGIMLSSFVKWRCRLISMKWCLKAMGKQWYNGFVDQMSYWCFLELRHNKMVKPIKCHCRRFPLPFQWLVSHLFVSVTIWAIVSSVKNFKKTLSLLETGIWGPILLVN